MADAPKMICPLLTVATIAAAAMRPATPSALVGIGPTASGKTSEPSAEPVACLGRDCMWFVPTSENGKITGGNCAVVHIPIGVAMLNNTVTAALNAAATTPNTQA